MWDPRYEDPTYRAIKRAEAAERERDEARQDRDYWAAEAQKDYAAIKEVARLRGEIARLRLTLQAIANSRPADGEGWIPSIDLIEMAEQAL